MKGYGERDGYLFKKSAFTKETGIPVNSWSFLKSSQNLQNQGGIVILTFCNVLAAVHGKLPPFIELKKQFVLMVNQ